MRNAGAGHGWESMRKMGKSSDIRAAVIDDLTFDPDVDASDTRAAEMNGDVVLTGSVPKASLWSRGMVLSDLGQSARVPAKRFEKNTTSRTVAAGRPPGQVGEPAVAPAPSAERKPQRILPLAGRH